MPTLMLLVLLAAPQSATAGTSLEFLKMCEGRAPYGSEGQTFCRAYSWGFVVGYRMGMATALGFKDDLPVCLPEKYSAEQHQRVVLKWLQDHPEKLDASPDLAMLGVLFSAFPCPGHQPPK